MVFHSPSQSIVCRYKTKGFENELGISRMLETVQISAQGVILSLWVNKVFDYISSMI